MNLVILETTEGFYFENNSEFKPVFKNPYIALSKKENVGKKVVKFDLQDFINLIDLSWETEGRENEVKLMRVGKAKDYRHCTTTILVWENRSINSNGKDRKGLYCGLSMNHLDEKIYKILMEMKK
jgi:hypothetical protein